MEISNPDQWSPGDVAVSDLRHPVASRLRTRSLLSTEMVEEVEGWMAVTDVDANDQRYVKFCIDDAHDPPTEEQEAQLIVDDREEPYLLKGYTLQRLVYLCLVQDLCYQGKLLPERREGLTPAYDPGLNTAPIIGSPGFRNRVSAPQDIPAVNREGLTPRPDTVRRDTGFTSRPPASNAHADMRVHCSVG